MPSPPKALPSRQNDLDGRPPARLIHGDGEMAQLTREHDWSRTPLGPVDQWPDALLITVNTVLASRQPMFLFWGQELIQFYNDAYRPSLGPDKHPTALGQRGRECWPEIWGIIGPQIDSVMREGAATWHEDALVPYYRDGKLEDIYWTYSYSPVRDARGEIQGILVNCTETTGRVLAERERDATARRLSRVLQSIGDAVIVTDAEACILSMNPVAEQLTGWSEAEAAGVSLDRVFLILHESSRQLSESPVAKVVRLGTTVGLANHTLLVRRDGTEVSIDDSAAPIRSDDGKLIGIVLVFRDIAGRRAAERERDALSAQLQLIMDALPSYVSYIGRDLRYVRVNRRYVESFGQPAEHIVGRAIDEVLGDAAFDIRPHLEAALAGQPQQFEVKVKTVDGERTLQIVQLPDVSGDGQVRGVVVQGADITDLRRSEAALRQSEKLAAVGRLASSIAHEINNPLESVTNLLYLCQASEDLLEVQHYLELAERELRRVSAISSQTLRFHKQATNPTPVTCEELIESVLALYQGRLVNSHVVVDKRKRTNEAVVCFEGEIRQVLHNLVGNAIDAMHPLGGRLLVRSRKAIDWDTGRRGLVITLADTGTGMNAQTLKKLYEPFYTTKGIGGTGLGLWLSKEIVDRHHGALRVRSSQKEGRTGTVIALFLPHDAAVR